MGKTSFSQSLTINWCQAHRPDQSISDKFTKVNLEAMRYFDLLFLIHLRNYQGSDFCNVDDMISEMLSKCSAITDKYPRQLIQHLLEEKRCLVVLDGLDEWTHPATCPRKPQVPHNNHTKLCSTITTTRPWKLSSVGLAANNIDRHVEICLLDWKTSRELEVNAVNILNENNSISEPKDLEDFDELVCWIDIGEIRHIPYIKLQLICLWYDGEPIGKSRCEIYSNVIELTLKRGIRKPGLPIMNTTEARDAIPKCMKNNELCCEYINLLLKIGQLAFFSLFHEVKESSLIISRKTVLKYMNVDELEFCLKIGLLSQNKNSGRVSDISHNVSFQHKSIQEFFSALFITAEWCKELTQVTIRNMCRSIREILEISNVFIFVCGMKPDVYSSIVQQILERDEISRNYRSSGMEESLLMEIIQSYQDMQIAAFVESLTNESERYPIPLQDIILDTLMNFEQDEHGEYFISQLMFSTNSVKSIYGRYSSYLDENLFFKDDTVTVFQNIEALKILNSGSRTRITSDLLTYSVNSLKYLHLDNIDSGSYIYTHNGRQHKSCNYKTVEMIFSSIASCTLLETIKMHRICCKCNPLDCCGFKLSLSQLSQLRTLDLSEISLTQLDLPKHSQLQKMSLTNIQLSALDLSECIQLHKLSLSLTTLPVLDLSECSQMSDLSLYQHDMFCSDQVIKIRLNTNILESCYITAKYVLPHDSLRQLFQSIEKGKDLKRISIEDIQCSEHSDNCPGFPLIFSCQGELEGQCQKWIPLSQLDTNQCSKLKSSDLVGLPLSHLDLPLNTQLQTLTLRKISLSQLDLTLCTQLQNLELFDLPIHEIYLNTCSLEKCIILNRNSSYPMPVDYMRRLYITDKSDGNGLGNLILPHENLHQLFRSIGVGNKLKTLLLQLIQCSDHNDKCPGIPFTSSHQDQLEQLDLKGVPLILLDTTLYNQLSTLILYDIPLSQLDLSRNLQLKTLDMRRISLSQLDLTHNSKIDRLILEDIPLSEVLLNTESLASCEIYQNKISHAIHVPNNSLHQLLCSFGNWGMLKHLKLKNIKCTDRPNNCTDVPKKLFQEHPNKKVKYAYQEWPHPADTASPDSQNVDNNLLSGLQFKQFILSKFLISRQYGRTNIDYVDIEQLSLVHDTIHQVLCSVGNITCCSNVNLKHIQCLDHSNRCPGVQLTVLQESKLNSLKMQTIPISELNISCNKLMDLHLKDIPITVLDISRNSNLSQLHIEEIPLDAIDITQNTRLTNLYLKNLPLSVLYISRNNNLNVLHLEKIPLTELIMKTVHPTNVTPTDSFISRGVYLTGITVYLTEMTMTASVCKDLFLNLSSSHNFEVINLNSVTMPASAWKELLIDILLQTIQRFTLKLQLCKGPTRQEWENILTKHSSLSGITISTDSDAVYVYASGTIRSYQI